MERQRDIIVLTVIAMIVASIAVIFKRPLRQDGQKIFLPTLPMQYVSSRWTATIVLPVTLHVVIGSVRFNAVSKVLSVHVEEEGMRPQLLTYRSAWGQNLAALDEINFVERDKDGKEVAVIPRKVSFIRRQ